MNRIYALIQRAQEGDAEAKTEILMENSGLIWSVVKRFYGRHEQDDLYQIGVIGLLKCIDKFDFRYNVRFSTYAVPMIAGEIRRFLRDDGRVKVSRSLKELAYRAKKLQEQALKEDNREISIAELAEKLETDKEELILALDSSKEVESLFEGQGKKGEEYVNMIDQLADTSENDRLLEQICLKEAMTGLEKKERQIIVMRYFQDKTQSEVAQKIGISQVQVSRIERKILSRLKDAME